MTTWVHTSSQSDISNPTWLSESVAAATSSVVTVAVEDSGIDYVINDVLILNVNGDGDCRLKVTAVHLINGGVIAVSLTAAGSGYAVDEICSTTTDSISGNGCTIKITGISSKFVDIPLSADWIHTSLDSDPIHPTWIEQSSQICKDASGNIYQPIRIGNQEWMAENLKTTKYNDGIDIPIVSSSEWPHTTEGSYGIYEDSVAHGITYGKLYNWHAVNTGNLAPVGWHVPTYADLIVLKDYITNDGHSGEEGAALKEVGYENWNDSGDSDEVGLDIYGFTALPGGQRNQSSNYQSEGNLGLFWSSTKFGDDYAWFLALNYGSVSFGLTNSYLQQYGLSVRCVRNSTEWLHAPNEQPSTWVTTS